jgi:hypothetical protein
MPLPIDKLVSETLYSATLIEKRIDQISRKDFPSETPRKLLKSLKKICAQSRINLIKYRQDFDIAPVPTIKIIQFISFFLKGVLARDIRFAEGASLDRTPGSLVRALEKLVDDSSLLTESTLLIRPQWSYNFKIFEFKNYYEDTLLNFMENSFVDELFKDFRKRIYIISFPGFQRNNLLVQTVLGHEIGHPIADEFLCQEPEDYKYTIQKEVEKEFNKEWKDKGLTKDERDKEKAEKIIQISKLRDGFLSEIISDLVEGYLFNFGALFAMTNLLFSFHDLNMPDIEDVENPHPAWRTRLRFVYDDLIEQWEKFEKRKKTINHDESEYYKKTYEVVKKNLIDIKAIVKDNQDEKLLDSASPITKIAYRFTKNAIPNVKKWLDKRVPKYCFNKNFNKIIKCLIRLHNNIPPNAINEKNFTSQETIDLQTILITGILYKETFLAELVNSHGNEYIKDLEKLNRLMMKAIELSMIQEEFNYKRRKEILSRQFNL